MSVGVGIHEAKTNFSERISRAAFAGERFIVQRRGKPMAAIMRIKLSPGDLRSHFPS